MGALDRTEAAEAGAEVGMAAAGGAAEPTEAAGAEEGTEAAVEPTEAARRRTPVLRQSRSRVASAWRGIRKPVRLNS
jgi:hypothetical protein